MLASVRRPISTGGLYDGINPVIPYFGGLNPKLNDADLDKDNDKPTNLEEFNLGLNSNNWDTDGVSLPDYYEVYYGLNPLHDGSNEFSWNSDYTYKTTANNNPEEGKNGDFDGDGISDYNETHYSEAYGWLVDWGKQKSSDYNNSDKSGEEFNYTEYINNQFNPFVKENIPPMITDIVISTDVASHTQWSWPFFVVDHCWAVVTVYVFDVAPFDITVTAGDHKSSQAFSFSAGKHFRTANLDIDYWTDLGVDYKVNITSEDAAGNAVYFEKKINGVFGGVLDALADVWNAIVGAFEAAAKAVGDAVNLLLEWIKEMVMAMIQPVIDGLNTMMSGYFGALAQSIKNSWSEYENTSEINISTVSVFVNELNKLLLAFAMLAVVILAVGTLITPFTIGIGTLVSIVIGIAISMIIGELMGSNGDTGISNSMSINNLISYIINMFGGSSGSYSEKSHAIFSYQNPATADTPGVSWIDWLILFLTMTVSTSAFVFIKDVDPILGAVIGFSLAAIIGFGALLLQGTGGFDNDVYLLKKAITIQTFLAAVSILLGMAGLLYADLSTGLMLLTIISVFIGGICVVYYYDIYEKLLVEG